jgi:hypothetical protein
MQKNYRVYLGFTKDTDQNVNMFAQGSVESLTGHPVFTDPPIKPADLGKLQVTFNQSMLDASDGGATLIRQKKAAKTALTDALVKNGLYVQLTARQDLDTLLSSGYDVCSTNRTSSPLDTPSITAIVNGIAGQLIVRATPLLNAKGYQAQTSTDGGKTWVDMGDFGGARRIELDGLTSGTAYMIRVRGVGGSTQYSPWSDPLTRVAT